MAVIELTRPEVLLKPDVQGLLKRAVESEIFLAPAGWDTVAQDIINFVIDRNQFLILGAEKGEWKGCILGYLPVGNLFPYPTIVCIYNEGSRALSREMQDHLLETITKAGYTRLLAVNTSGHEDAVWLRGLTPEGAKSRITGSLALFEVK